MRGQIGILRHCVICGNVKSVDEFGAMARACQSCMRGEPHAATGRIGLARGIVLTDKARALLASERVTVEAGSV